MAHEYVEAFMLMEYASEDGTEREVLWNSRDGITPFIIPSATSDRDLAHCNWRSDRYAPNHVPKVGDRIFVDMTPQRARVLAARQVEQMEASEYRAELEQRYESREAAVEAIAKELLGEWGGRGLDILTVTSGYLEELAKLRATKPAVVATITGVDPGGVDQFTAVMVAAPGAAEPPSLLFDRQRRPIDMHEFERLIMDEHYKHVAFTVLLPEESADIKSMRGAKKGFFVSTVWLGMNHNFLGAPEGPIIFETIIWQDGAWGHKWRWHTEEEARIGHEGIVNLYRGKLAELSRKKN